MLQVFPGCYHQLYDEVNKQSEEALSDTVKWITDIMSSS